MVKSIQLASAFKLAPPSASSFTQKRKDWSGSQVSLPESRRRKSDDREEGMGAQEREEEDASSVGRKLQKTSKEVYFSVLPDKYEPLIEDDEEREETAEEKKRKKEARKKKRKNTCKKYRKNVGKALRFSWRCLVTGLQSMASVYSTPLSAVATVVTNVHQASGSKT
ncbi:uncharacterized protein C1orf115 homolog [Haplochromis burtoni]|nr:uncharacterized protein C1orf115 homolog [Haplochromis burtoni]